MNQPAAIDILITGATGGVAGALIERLHQRGHRLALVARDVDVLHERAGADDCIIEADVSTEAGAQHAIQAATAAFGSTPAGLVHAAGSTLLAPLHRTTETQYRAAMAANADSAFFTLRAWTAARVKAADEDTPAGAAVLFSSVVAAIGVPNHEAIAMAKGAVAALVAATAATYASQGLRVNAIAPGLTRTGATERLFANAQAEAAITAQYPLGRYGQADDQARLAEFLLLDASWMTGEILACDGGFTHIRPLLPARTRT
ncbi:MAG: SDR family NAD(P)-dependent oxidoreductase [Thioalkalivibrionaceae bacterium]